MQRFLCGIKPLIKRPRWIPVKNLTVNDQTR